MYLLFREKERETSLFPHCRVGVPGSSALAPLPLLGLKGHLAKSKGKGKHRVLQGPNLSLPGVVLPSPLPNSCHVSCVFCWG